MEQQRPTRVRYGVMAFLCALSFLTYFDRQCIVRVQGDIQRDLKLDDGQLAFVFSAFWLAYALFEIPSGWWGDRFGPRMALVRIVLAWSLFTALSGTAVGFVSLLCCRFLFGVGEAGAFPNMAAIQSRWLPVKSRARAGGLLWLCARWGGAFAPLIFGYLIQFFDAPWFRQTIAVVPGLREMSSWRFGFFTSGLMGLVWCALFFSWFRNTPVEKAGVNQAERDLIGAGRGGTEQSNSHGHEHFPGIWSALLSCPSLWAMAALYICSSFGYSFFMSWMPRYLKDVHGVEFAKSEWMSVMPLFCGGITCLLGGWISDWVVKRTGWRKMGRAIFPIFGYAVAAGAMFAIRYTHDAHEAAVLMCIAAAANDFGQAANWATFVDIGGRYSGTSTGFINMVGNLGQAGQPLIGAWIFNSFGWDVLFLVYSAAFIGAGAMWIFIDPRKTFYESAAVRGQITTDQG